MRGYLPFVAFTVHKRVYPPVEQIVLGAEALDPVRTVPVVLPATAVGPRVAPHFHVPLGQGALAAVLGARYNKHTRQIATFSAKWAVHWLTMWI